MIKYLKSTFCICLVCISLMDSENVQASTADDQLQDDIKSFMNEVEQNKIPEFDYSFEKNISAIQDLSGIKRQRKLFAKYRKKMRKLNRRKLSPDHRVMFDLMNYEIDFNLSRVELERKFRKISPNPELIQRGISQMPNHLRWHELYLSRWASRKISAVEILELGIREVEKVKAEISDIQKGLGYEGRDLEFYSYLNDHSFFITDVKEALAEYKGKQQIIEENMGNLFYTKRHVSKVNIELIPEATKDSPPGYYTDKTFYLNFYGNKHNRRAMDWLFLHEAVPGHHYHTMKTEEVPLWCKGLRRRFWYPGHSEGWAAYIEHLGEELGLYNSELDWLGKWEWDLVRSLRLVLEVGINSGGWTDNEALLIWRKYIPNQEHIALREIARIRRWPGQVVSYKVGEAEVFSLKKNMSRLYGPKFDIKKFHSLLVKKGSLPLPVLRKYVLENYK